MTFTLGSHILSTETGKFWFYITCSPLNLFYLIPITFFAYFQSYPVCVASHHLAKSKKRDSDSSCFLTNTYQRVRNIAANSWQLSFYVRNYSTSSSLSPVKTYRNTGLHKLQIIKENKGKSGVYPKNTSFKSTTLRFSFIKRNRNFSTNSSVNVSKKELHPVKIYRRVDPADIDKFLILNENKDKSGVYRWINLLNGKSYIGSSVNLEKRMRRYFSISFLELNKVRV